MTYAVLASHEHIGIMLRPLRMGGIQNLDAPDLFFLLHPAADSGRSDLPRIKEQVPIAPIKKV